MAPTPSEIARAYHATTKHHPQRFARALGYMDWDTQPDPFRRYPGAAEVPLPFAEATGTLTHAAAARGAVETGPVADLAPPARLGRLLELCLGLTAWKQFEGNRWALRANPSSGNLHPTEGYVVVPAGHAGLPAGVSHYAPREHALELRRSLPAVAAERLAELLPPGAVLIGLTSVLWREAWKYGERALRYCCLDTGHARAGIDQAAACVGWRTAAVSGWSDADLGALLGTDRDGDFADVDAWEREHPELLLCAWPASAEAVAVELDPDAVLATLAPGTWHGQASALSSEHHEWDVIHATAAAVERADRGAAGCPTSGLPARRPDALALSTAPLDQLLRQRRSAVAMRTTADMALEVFLATLDATLPRPDVAPWRSQAEGPDVDLLLFVHRVAGLDAGLYLLERGGAEPGLRSALGPGLTWARPTALDDSDHAHLALHQLRSGRAGGLARATSCNQDIAADGHFAVAMIARFGDLVEADASRYRRLYWECGTIGQVLYVEAEAAGLRGTGIGCYFDDAVHQVLGLGGDAFQVLYHFTTGEPVDDDRLQTHPPYAHLER